MAENSVLFIFFTFREKHYCKNTRNKVFFNYFYGKFWNCGFNRADDLRVAVPFNGI